MATPRDSATGGSAVGYEFAQRPSAVLPKKSAYREPNPTPTSSLRTGPINIMHDRRVVRGSTYAAPIIPPAAHAEAERRQRDEEERLQRMRRLEMTRQAQQSASRSGTPEPMPGRTHMDVQTETFLEVISDRVPEEEAGVQTDPTVDRPPTPLFVPQPSGVDVATQIAQGDLFDFDFEIAPLLEVLVGRTVEAAAIEVAQEKELAAVRAKAAEYASIRAAEVAETQRLEAEVQRRYAEKARRVEQERVRAAQEMEIQRKVAATSAARALALDVREQALESLKRMGYFYDPLRRDIETRIMPQLLLAARASMEARAAATSVTNDLIAAALEKARQTVLGALARAAEMESLRKIEQAAATASQIVVAQASGVDETAIRETEEETPGADTDASEEQ